MTEPTNILPPHNPSEPKAIPKEIHFIWFGGPIKKDYFHTIRSLAIIAKKNNFKVHLWVDKLSNYEVTAAKEDIRIPNLDINTLGELRKEMDKNPFFKEKVPVKNPLPYQQPSAKTESSKKEEIATKTRKELLLAYMNREAVGAKNEASRSDFARFIILSLMGGYYFDTDTKFNIDEKTLFSEENPIYGFLSGNGSFKAVPLSNRTLALQYVGSNDILGATANNEITNQVLDQIIKNYQDFDTSYSPKNFFEKEVSSGITQMDEKRQNISNKRKDFTIDASGPGVLRQVFNKLNLNKEEKNNLLLAESNKIAGIKFTANSDQTWLKPRTESNYKKATHELLAAFKSLKSDNKEYQTLLKQYEEEINQKGWLKDSIKKDRVMSTYLKKDSNQPPISIHNITNFFKNNIQYHYTSIIKKMFDFILKLFTDNMEKQGLDLMEYGHPSTKNVNSYLKILKENQKNPQYNQEKTICEILIDFYIKYPDIIDNIYPGHHEVIKSPTAEVLNLILTAFPNKLAQKTKYFEEPNSLQQYHYKSEKSAEKLTSTTRKTEAKPENYSTSAELIKKLNSDNIPSEEELYQLRESDDEFDVGSDEDLESENELEQIDFEEENARNQNNNNNNKEIEEGQTTQIQNS